MSNGVYTPYPGTVKEAFCDICSAKMSVARNITGPTGWSEAMARRGHAHDFFSCDYRNEPWHKQVAALKREAEKTPSAEIATIYDKEAKKILKTKVATKQIHEY